MRRGEVRKCEAGVGMGSKRHAGNGRPAQLTERERDEEGGGERERERGDLRPHDALAARSPGLATHTPAARAISRLSFITMPHAERASQKRAYAELVRNTSSCADKLIRLFFIVNPSRCRPARKL